jgi:hypothetical protein
MKKHKRNGFVLLFVIMIILLIGIQLSVLAAVANIMSFQSDNAYLQACERNMRASGFAWARHNIENKTGGILNQTVKLDVSKMDIRGSVLNVTINNPAGKQPEVRINTSCTRGRQTIQRDNKYKIEL